jgi:hypothetical protein
MNQAEISARAIFVLVQRISELVDELQSATPERREGIEVAQTILRSLRETSTPQ